MNKGKVSIYILGLLLSCLSVANVVVADTMLKIEPVSVLLNTVDGESDSAKCIIINAVDLFCNYSIGGKNYLDYQGDPETGYYLQRNKALRADITKDNIAQKLTNTSNLQIDKDDFITIAIFYFFNNYSPQLNKDDIPENIEVILYDNKVKQLTIDECSIAENIEQKMLMMRLIASIGRPYDISVSCGDIFLQYYSYLTSATDNLFLINNQQWLKKYFSLGEQQRKWLIEGKVNNADIDAVFSIGKGITELSTEKLEELLEYPHALNAINDANKDGMFQLRDFSNKIQEIDDLKGISSFIDKLGAHKFDVVIGALTVDLVENKRFIENIEQMDSVAIACLAGNSLSKKSCFSTWYDQTKESTLFPGMVFFLILSLALLGLLAVLLGRKYNTYKYQVDNIVISSFVQALLDSREVLKDKGVYINQNIFSDLKKNIFVAHNSLLVEIFERYFKQLAQGGNETSLLRRIVRATKFKGTKKLSVEIRDYLTNRGAIAVQQIIEPLMRNENAQLEGQAADEIVKWESPDGLEHETTQEIADIQGALDTITGKIENLLEYSTEENDYSSSDLAIVRIESNLISYIQGREKEENLINKIHKELSGLEGSKVHTDSRNFDKKAEEILSYIYHLREKIHEYQQIEKI